MREVVGRDGFVRYVQTIDHPKMMPWVVSDVQIADVEAVGETCDKDYKFFGCFIRDCRLSKVEFAGCEVINSRLENVHVDGIRSVSGFYFLHVELQGCVIKGLRNKYQLYNEAFSRIDGCVFEKINLKGSEGNMLGTITNSSIAGRLMNVDFWENSERTQGVGLDLSKAVLTTCRFPGVDMDRIVCSEQMQGLIVPGWERYEGLLREKCEELVRENESEPLSERRRVPEMILDDLDDDEKAYGGPVNAQRGAKYLGLLNAKYVKDERKKGLRDMYRSVGIVLD